MTVAYLTVPYCDHEPTWKFKIVHGHAYGEVTVRFVTIRSFKRKIHCIKLEKFWVMLSFIIRAIKTGLKSIENATKNKGLN